MTRRKILERQDRPRSLIPGSARQDSSTEQVDYLDGTDVRSPDTKERSIEHYGELFAIGEEYISYPVDCFLVADESFERSGGPIRAELKDDRNGINFARTEISKDKS